MVFSIAFRKVESMQHGLFLSERCSVKVQDALKLTTRRIKLLATGAVYQQSPDFVLADMAGRTDEVEKGRYLRRFGVLFDALAPTCLDAPASYWYRLHQSLGR